MAIWPHILTLRNMTSIYIICLGEVANGILKRQQYLTLVTPFVFGQNVATALYCKAAKRRLVSWLPSKFSRPEILCHVDTTAILKGLDVKLRTYIAMLTSADMMSISLSFPTANES